MKRPIRFALFVTVALVTIGCGDADQIEGGDAASVEERFGASDASDGVAWRFSAPLIGMQTTSITVGTVSEERVGDRNGEAWRCPGEDDSSERCDEDERIASTVVQDHDSVVSVSETMFGPSVDQCVVSMTRRVEQRADEAPVLAWDLGFEVGDEVMCIVLERTGIEGIGFPLADGRIELARSYVSDTAESTDFDHSPLAEAFDGLPVRDAVSALAEIVEMAGADMSDEDAIAIVDSHRSE